MAEGSKGIQSIEQGIKILDSLVVSKAALPLKKIAEIADTSPSMAHRYIASFMRTGLITQDPVSGNYDLGPFALQLGFAALNRSDLIQIADDEFKQLVRRVNVDGSLSVWGNHGVTCVRIHNRYVPLLSDQRLGAVLSLYDSAAGRVFMAYHHQEPVRLILKKELSTIDEPKPTKENIAAIVSEVRENGYAWVDGQVFHGIRALAAPIFGPQGELRATMSLVSNQESLVQLPNAILDDLLETAARISRGLGWIAEPASKVVSLKSEKKAGPSQQRGTGSKK